jgi:uncharacterized protein (TIGR00162 family)
MAKETKVVTQTKEDKAVHTTQKNGWTIQTFEKTVPSLNKPLLLVGLPGIGNVGKIVVDFLIDELKAKKLFEIHSHHFPNTVFVTEENLVALPSIEIFYVKAKGKMPDLLLMSGDVQPIEQESCYAFCTLTLDLLQQWKGAEIVTLGGIGLQEVPEVPKVFCTGTAKQDVDRYVKGTTVNPNIYGVVGAFVGVAGVLVGLAGQHGISAVSFLAETFAHPYYIGIKGSKEILLVLQKKFGLPIDPNKLEKDIKAFEKELMQTAEQMEEVQKQAGPNRQSYIG